MYKVVGFGNALLDITVTLESDTLLKKYNLNKDDQKEISVNVMQALYNDISSLPQQINPGGCAQNTLRILQWLINTPNCTVFFGSVGDDKQSEILKKLVEDSGVTTRYKKKDREMTGKCIALVYEANRSLVAYLGAAESYTLNDLHSLERLETFHILNTSDIIYIEGYFLTKRLDVAEYIKNYAIKNEKVFAFNLCGEYLCNMLPHDVLNFAASADFVFGNEKEFLALGEVLNKNTLLEIGTALNTTIHSNYNSKNPLLRFGKVVVITRGKEKVMCFHNQGKLIEVDVIDVPIYKIRDTTGAGDGFVAGFLAGVMKNYDIEQCVMFGCWVSCCIIQEIGCNLSHVTWQFYTSRQPFVEVLNTLLS